LEALGDLTVYDRSAYHLSGLDKIIERAKDAEIVFTNKTPIPKEALLHMPQAKFIGVLATGYNIVDVAAAKEQGIVVSNIPTYGTTAVAQMVFALLLEMCHHVGAHNDSVKRGDWAASADWCYWHYPLIELAGKTMGIIGYGKIGRMVGDIAQAFGLKVLAYDRFPDKSLEKETMHYVPLASCWQNPTSSAYIAPYLRTQRVNQWDSIAKMKDGVMLVNTSRGPWWWKKIWRRP
jgi:glycerate dehydrogenase